MKKYDLVVIGSGPAGEKAAAQAAYFGKKGAVIEQFLRSQGFMQIGKTTNHETAPLFVEGV